MVRVELHHNWHDDLPKNWSEDWEHENGQYHCHCVHCGHSFIGHKRRVVCKRCATKPPTLLQRLRKQLRRLDDYLMARGRA